MIVAAPPTGPAPAPLSPHAAPPAGEQVLASFNYVIRGPQGVPKMAPIEARAWPGEPVAVTGGFDDAVAAARELASKRVFDGIHDLPLHQAHAVLQAADGSLRVAPLGGFHRGVDGPLFVDGMLFHKHALSLQVARTTRELLAVVGRHHVLDLRVDGSATITAGR